MLPRVFLAIAAFSYAVFAADMEKIPVVGKVDFHMKHDASFGGLALNNADFVDYVVELDWVDRSVHLSYATLSGHEGNILPSATRVVLPLPAGTWRLIGDNGLELDVPVAWGSVAWVELAADGDASAVGMAARLYRDNDVTARQPLMSRIERPPEHMPRHVEPPKTETPPLPPGWHPFGIRTGPPVGRAHRGIGPRELP